MSNNIIKYEFKPGLPLEFEIIPFSGLYSKSRDIIIKPHRTSFYHIIWFEKGTTKHLVDFKPVPIKENNLLFLNKDVVQVYEDKPKAEGIAIVFTDSFFSKSEADIKFLHESILFNDLFSVSIIELKKQAGIFSNLVKLMKEELSNRKDAMQGDILKNLLHNFLLYAERERREQNFQEVKKGADLDYVLLFKDLIEANYKKNKQVSFFASSLSVTEKRLNLAINKILGKTAKQMIDERIMLEAKRLLAHSHESIKEIAYSLGFDEPTNFIKFFRRNNQHTPVEFREKFLG
ncbi:AraC family transcriptional regulator [Chitinophaga tropicalis]|uniref:Helix-turn-helix domain-containing protein n=1 Tax=Chitinophaga tropicalis TaxID=2683588 RepID=A0A7K1U5C6_9BACT|nr:helix-turn-helix transcriptional regulator [Chitinophaga tropicalis]MVT09539.1 helix-turn-helix domain-containing protein [Chitinophaga tropicalis]